MSYQFDLFSNEEKFFDNLESNYSPQLFNTIPTTKPHKIQSDEIEYNNYQADVFIFSIEDQQRLTEVPCIPLRQKISKRNLRQKIPKELKIQEKTLGKNFPKQMGKYLIKHLELHSEFDIPKGIQNLKEKAELMKKNNKEVSFAIQDYVFAVQSDNESQQYLKDFVKNKLPIYLIHSPMIEDPTKLYQFIHNAYVGICNPTQWRGNYQTKLKE